MAVQTITQFANLQVSPTEADLLRSLMSKAGFEELKETGQPLVFSINGKPIVMLEYEALLDELDSADAIKGIEEGKADKLAGRVRSAKEFFQELRIELGEPKKEQA